MVHSVEFISGGSRGTPSMAAAPDLPLDHGQYPRARRSKANLFVPSPSPSSPPVTGADLTPELHCVGNGETVTPRASVPFV